MKKLTFIVLVVFSLSLSIFPVLAQNAPTPLKEEIPIFEQIFFYIQNYYLYDIDINKCQYEILKGLAPKLATPANEEKTVCLDKHSAFHTPDEIKLLDEEMAGHFGGIGLELETQNNRAVVRNVKGNGPAEKSGFLAGDIIAKVREEKDTDYTDINDVIEAVKKIRGPIGTTVVITVERSGTLLELKAVRQDIRVKETERA